MARGRKGASIQKTIGILAYGEQGTWKSSIGAEALALKKEDGTPMRVLIFDSEFGGIDTALEDKQEKYGFDLDNAYIIYTESYEEIVKFIDRAKKGEPFYEFDDEGEEMDDEEHMILDADGKQFVPDFIVLDGSTVVYNASSIAKVKFSEKRARVKAKKDGLSQEEVFVKTQGADLEFKDYKKLNTEMSQELILKLISSGKHYYITARETDEKMKVKGADGKFENVPTGKKIPEGFKGMEYNVGTVLRLFIDEEFNEVKGQIMNKDRNGVYSQNQIIDEPSLLAWQKVINGNKGKKKVTVAPTFSESIEKEYQKELEKSNMTDEEVVNNGEMGIDDYRKSIQEIFQKLTSVEKGKLQAKLNSLKINRNFKKLEDIEELKTYLDIVKNKDFQ